jgi:hypothetical protein
VTLRVCRTGAIDEARRLGWDTLAAPDDLFHSSAYLSLEGGLADTPPVYFVAGAGADQGGSPDAAVTCYPLSSASEPWPFMRIDSALLHLARRRGLTVSDQTTADLAGLLPTHLYGCRRAPDTRVLLTSRGTDEERARIVAAFVDHLEQDARERGVRSMAFLFVSEGDTAARHGLRRSGYEEFPSARYATLRLDGTDFDAYLARFSRDRQREIRRERRRMHEAVRFTVEPLTSDLIQELVPLLLQHGRRYGHAYTSEGLTRGMSLHRQHLGQQVSAVTARSSDGRARGFATIVAWGGRVFVRQTGFDYDWQGRLPLYFGVCYYEPIEYAMRIGATALDMAIESEVTKLSRGCELDQRFGYLKVLDEASRTRVEPLVRQIRAAAREPDVPG